MASKKGPSPIDVHVGARIRMRRLMLGVTQEKLADGLGLTFQQVQKYEKGSNRVGASRLQQIGTILGVEPAFFFEGVHGSDAGKGEGVQPGPITGFLATSEGLALVSAFQRIKTAKLRRSVLQLVENLADS